MLPRFESWSWHVKTITETETIPLIVDRSPELRRNNQTPSGAGANRVHTAAPSGRECVQGDGTSCVIAALLKNILPGCEPHVEGEHPYVIFNGERRELTMDKVIVDAIGRFDRGDLDAFDNINITFTWD